MEKRGKKLLGILNSKLVILFLIFIMFFLATIFAGNVIVKEGNLDVDDDLSVVGNVTVNGSMNIVGPLILSNNTFNSTETFINIETALAYSTGSYVYTYTYCPTGYTIIYCSLYHTTNRDPNGNADYQRRWADISDNGCKATAYAANGIVYAGARGLCVMTS